MPLSARAGNFINGSERRDTAPTPADQTNSERAAHLDRSADAWLFLGRHDLAEHLAHQAESLRQEVAQ